MNPASTPSLSTSTTTDSEKQSPSIVRAAIHPSIGVARLGNSPEEYFLAPEVVDPPPQPPRFYRDASGALKRQAVRFRIYGLNAQGQVVAELTQSNAEITWNVHLANKKAAWYQFQIALDIPEADSAPHSYLRNITVSDRSNLVIDPGSREITGVNIRSGSLYAFDTGQFMGKPVYLGEVRTDEQGRLMVFRRPRPVGFVRLKSGGYLCQQRGLVRRYVGRASHGDREVPGNNTRSRSRLGGGCACELRTGAKIGPHHVGLVARHGDQGAQIAGANSSFIQH